MSSKQILDYWEDSFQLLRWGQLKLSLLAGLNNFVRSVKLTIGFGWWLVPFLLLPIMHTIMMETSLAISLLESIIMITALNLIFFVYILSSRASLERKDTQYFSTYTAAAPGMLALTFLSSLFSGIGSIILLSAYFYMDSNFRFRDMLESILNSIKFLIYFPAIVVPFIILNWLSFSFFAFIIPTTLYNISFVTPAETPSHLAYFIMLIIPYSLVISISLITLIFMFLSFFQLSLLSIFYVKIKHTYPDLFLGQ
ncbi:MAG: hypothetical protein US49_C0001G0165 [candidate division TM6 bacterium GW2011_GWF2_37_49]|nr:MAG: hypothetical protein US49_C0001G0165 [candidate division TM6 bacterium GW2011_GWF2_37_49]